MGVTKPTSVSADPFRSAKWDEICDGRDFRPSDAPALTLLVQWYQVVDKCIEDLSTYDGIDVAYENKMGDKRAMPQIGTMKQASAEIRALNKQLGIVDGHEEGASDDSNGDAAILSLVQGNRAERRARA